MYLRCTEYSPIPSDVDHPVFVGPFSNDQEVQDFLAQHGRVFRSDATVYSPAEYALLVATLETE